MTETRTQEMPPTEDDDVTSHVVLHRIAISRIEENSKRAFGYALAALTFRGVLLWAVIPLTASVWLILTPFRMMRHKESPSIRQYLAWSDEALLAVGERTLLLPFGMRGPWPKWPRHRGPSRTVNPFELV
jgi:hypothetical protein